MARGRRAPADGGPALRARSCMMTEFRRRRLEREPRQAFAGPRHGMRAGRPGRRARAAEARHWRAWIRRFAFARASRRADVAHRRTDACTDHGRRRLRRIAPRRGAPRRAATRSSSLDNLSTGSIDNIAHLKCAPEVPLHHRHASPTSRCSPSSIDRCDVVVHLAAAVGVKLIVEAARPHHRDQRARHRGRPQARQQEEEAGPHRLDLRGLRQEHGRAVPRGRRPGARARRTSTAGPTPAAR